MGAPMQRLILFRHAKAERTSPTGEDFDRPLSPQGREDARLTGRALADAGYRPDLALVSAARRTIQTWEAAAVAFPQARVEIIRNLFNADSDTLLDAARSHAERAETLMLVAHNPGAHELASRLTTDARLDRGFPTSAAAVFELEAPDRYRLAALLGGEGGGAG